MNRILKNKTHIAFLLFLIFFLSCEKKINQSWIHEGDLVFQRRTEVRYKIMDFLQSSYYNHAGIIVKKGDGYRVISAETTVKEEDLKEWLSRGEGKHFMILRPSSTILENIKNIIRWARFYKGRMYDYAYEWDERKIYNAELIQKAFLKGAHVYLGETKYIDTYFIAPEDTTIFFELKNKVPYGKEVVTIESIISSGYLKNILKN
jgi:hypothetical protein